MPYLRNKQLGIKGHVEKTDAERVVTETQFRAILAAVKKSGEMGNNKWRRDYAAIYLGYMMGLRVSEVSLLRRDHFRGLIETDVVRLPTLKQSRRTAIKCPNDDCRRVVRIRTDRHGEFRCSRCGAAIIIPAHEESARVAAAERDVPFIEEQVVEFVAEYLEQHMRPDQDYLIEGRKGRGISSSHLEQIFGYYVQQVGLSHKFSWHALRHGRGVRLWGLSHDLLFVSRGLRQQSLSSAQKYMHLDPMVKAEYKLAAEKVAFDPLSDIARKS